MSSGFFSVLALLFVGTGAAWRSGLAENCKHALENFTVPAVQAGAMGFVGLVCCGPGDELYGQPSLAR